jgi:hypothetical protein
LAVNLLRKVAQSVEDIAGMDSPPQMEGRGLSMILAPARNKKPAATTTTAAPTAEKGSTSSSNGQVQA